MNNEGAFSVTDPTYLRRCQNLLAELENAGNKIGYLRTHLQDFDREIVQVLTIFGEVCQEVGDYTSAGQAVGLLSILDTLPTSIDSASMAETESWLLSVSWQEMALALGLTGAVHTADEENREEWFAELLGELQDSHPALAVLFDRFGEDQETQAQELSKLVGELRDEDADIDQLWSSGVSREYRPDREGEAMMSQTEGSILPEELIPYMEELEQIEAIPPDARDRDIIERQQAICQKLLRRIDKTATPDLWAVVQTFLGDAYETLYERLGNESDHSVAEQAYRSALRFLQEVQSPFGMRTIPVLQQNLGRLYVTMFSLTGLVRYAEQAETAYHTSLQRFEDDGRRDEWASVQNSLGNLYADMYKRKEDASYADAAITAYRSALDVRSTRSDRSQLGDTENHLAIVYQQMYRKTHRDDHAREAEAGFQRALELCDFQADPSGWARIRNNLGLLYANIYLHTGEDNYAEEALRAYGDALIEFPNEDDPSTWAGIQSNRALLFAYRYKHNPEDRYAQASADAYQQALRVFMLGSTPARVTATARSLALLYLHFEYWQEAHDAFAIALRAAHNLYLASPGGPERHRHVAEYARLCMWDARCLLHLGDPAAAWSQVEAGRTLQLLEAIGLEEAAYVREGEKGVERIREVRRKVQEAQSNLIVVAPKPQSLLAQIMQQEMLDEREQARQGLEKAYTTLNSLVEEMGLKTFSVKAEELLELSLPSAAAAVTIILTVEETVALILYNGRITSVPLPQFTARHVYELVNAIPTETITWCQGVAPRMADQLMLMRQAQIEEENEEKLGTPLEVETTHLDSVTKSFEGHDDPLVRTGWLIAYLFAFAMPDQVSHKIRETAERGWRTCISRTIAFLNYAFWQPILAALPLSVQQILLSPTGATALLPLHAAVIDRITVAYTPSLSVWQLCQQRATNRTEHSCVIANPSHNLEFAEAETQWLQHRFDSKNWATTQLLGNQATVSAVCSSARGKGLIHYAGHAKYNWSDPMQSALDCADGKLILSEIRQTVDLDSTRLVTLSACESGISDTSTSAEEFLGLPAILLEVGAPAIVASLWPAPDVSTAFLMDFFYEKWLSGKSNVTIADALRESVIWLRSTTKDELLQRIDDSNVLPEQKECLKGIIEGLNTIPFAEPLYWAVFAAYAAVL